MISDTKIKQLSGADMSKKTPAETKELMSRVFSSANTEAHGETITDEVSFDVASLDYGASSRHEDAFVCSIAECTNTPTSSLQPIQQYYIISLYISWFCSKDKPLI